MEPDLIFGNALRAAFGIQAASYALLAIGLNMHYGYTGLANFGQVGFMMLSAYGASIMVVTWGGSLWIGIPFGLLLCVAFALLLGIPTLRLRSDYFAITTIAAAEVLRLLIRSTSATDLTGGPFGLNGVASAFNDLNPFPSRRFGIGTFAYTGQQLWVMVVAWGLVVSCTVLLWALMRSPWGRVILAIREDEDAAASLGKNVFAFKLQALVIGGVIGGLAGTIDVLQQSGVTPVSYRPEVTFFAYTALILGGAATRIGPIFGAVVFWFLKEATETTLRQIAEVDALPDLVTDFVDGSEGAISIALVGLSLMLLVSMRPQGVFGDRTQMLLEVRR